MEALVAGLELDTLWRLLLALACGAAIGLERELSGKPAGLRTNMLICVGAELFTELSILIAGEVVPHDRIMSDPARLAAQIVSGIGFLGAGTILVMRGNVVGLTTAATIWVVAAIGVAVGVDAHVEAVGATVLVVIVLFALGRFEQRVLPAGSWTAVTVALADPHAGPATVEELLEEMGYRGRPVGWEREADRSTFRFMVRSTPEECAPLLRRLAELDAVRSAKLE